jgi:putative membrane protein
MSRERLGGGLDLAFERPGANMTIDSKTLVRGTIVGLCATQALDWVSIFLYDNEAPATRTAEDRARGHRHAYEVAVDRAARRLGRALTDDQVSRWGWRFHKVFGILGGLGYLALRRGFPRLRWGYGLAFGAAFFVVVDEIMVPLQRLTPGPFAFSWKVHARGAAAHVAYGVAAETTARMLDGRTTL